MLTKSLFTIGENCPKALWLEIHRPNLKAPPSESDQARMRVGQTVGSLARDLFPGGIAVPFGLIPNDEAALKTAELSRSEVPFIFEATFIADRCLARADVLERAEGGWNLIELKSSGQYEAKKHLNDVGYQVLVLRAAGLPITGAALLHLEKAYIKENDGVDVDRLFARRELMPEIENALPAIASETAAFSTLWSITEYPSLGGVAPHVDPDISPTCRDCPFSHHCFELAPANHVFYLGLHHSRVKRLRQAGIRTIDTIPNGFDVNAIEAMRMRAHLDGSPVISPDLSNRLAEIQYPAFCLDFETLRPALPLLRGTHPYELIPFQWSCHRLDGPPDDALVNGGPATGHSDFLHEDRTDPRGAFVRSLLTLLESGGSILHYSPYEKSTIKALVDAHIPGATDLLTLVESRLLDLEAIIKECYAHAGFEGRTSIKAVLPVLCPDLSYKELAIHNGDEAMAKYERTYADDCPEAERQAVFDGLRTYCRQDTWAMVRVLAALYEAVN